MTPQEEAETARQILRQSKTIAVVGISDNPDRPSNSVARYMQQRGYRIIPVNPNVDEVFGIKAYANLESVPEPIDVVEVFRRSELTDEVIDSAIAVGARAVWLQLGIRNPAGIERARQAGLLAVQDRCMAIDVNFLDAA